MNGKTDEEFDLTVRNALALAGARAFEGRIDSVTRRVTLWTKPDLGFRSYRGEGATILEAFYALGSAAAASLDRSVT